MHPLVWVPDHCRCQHLSHHHQCPPPFSQLWRPFRPWPSSRQASSHIHSTAGILGTPVCTVVTTRLHINNFKTYSHKLSLESGPGVHLSSSVGMNYDCHRIVLVLVQGVGHIAQNPLLLLDTENASTWQIDPKNDPVVTRITTLHDVTHALIEPSIQLWHDRADCVSCFPGK